MAAPQPAKSSPAKSSPARPPSQAGAAAAVPSNSVIAGRFAVDLTRPLPGAGGGMAAFAATDRRDGRARLMAVQVRAGAPPRTVPLAQLAGVTGPGVLLPLAHGPASGPDRKPAWFVICPAPPGPALWPSGAAAPRAWSDGDLIGRLLRPAAAALALLAAQRVTHRALRPDNIFLDPAPAGGGLTLGCAWATPPALLQPALFEPPYVAMCPAAARGDGVIADDVYALGVTILVLALGRLPLIELDDTAIIRRKLEQGCFQALAGTARLSPVIGDLVKGMLAQDPQHRPQPAMLSDPAAARARHVAARPLRRAPRSLDIGGITAWDARTLAFAMAGQPDQSLKLLRLGVVDHWLRRVLGDSALASRLEEAMARRGVEGGKDDAEADAKLGMRAVAMLDPLAPLCWRGLAIWPDGFGPALAADGAETAESTRRESGLRDRIEEMIGCEAVSDWAPVRAEHCDVQGLRALGRQYRAALRLRGWAGGLPRLIYELNHLLPCRSPLLGTALVARLAELLPALEAAASRSEVRALMPIDREIAAFIAAHQGQRLEADIAALPEAGAPGVPALAQLTLLARLQEQVRPGPLPGVAGWVASLAAPLIEGWHSRGARQARQAALTAAIPAGDLSALLALLDDPGAREADRRAFDGTRAGLRRIDGRLAAIAGGAAARAETARRLGQEIAAALGLAALAATAVAMALR